MKEDQMRVRGWGQKRNAMSGPRSSVQFWLGSVLCTGGSVHKCITIHCALYTVQYMIRLHAFLTLCTVVQGGLFITNYLYIMMCRVKCEHGASFDRRNRFCSTGLFHIARDTVGKYPLICGWSVKQEYLRLPPKFGFTQKKIWIEPPPFGTTSKQHLFYISFLWVVSQVVTDIVAL